MIEYKKLNEKEGWLYLSKIWTVFLSKDPDLWVNPFEHRDQRYRCLFMDSEKCIYLYLTSHEIVKTECLDVSSDGIFFSGAYNQINVCQMRSVATIESVGKYEKSYILFLIEKRLRGEKIPSDNFKKYFFDPNKEEKMKALKYLRSDGILFCIKPSSFEYHTYERG